MSDSEPFNKLAEIEISLDYEAYEQLVYLKKFYLVESLDETLLITIEKHYEAVKEFENDELSRRISTNKKH